MMMVLMYLTTVCLAGMVMGYPGGAPQSQCSSLRSPHAPTISSRLYSINMGSVTDYTPGQNIEVIVEGKLQGLMMQVRKKGTTTPQGRFIGVPSSFQWVQCSYSDSTVTHRDATDKAGPATFTWKAPDADVGQLELVTTIMQDISTYQQIVVPLPPKGTDPTFPSSSASSTPLWHSMLFVNLATYILVYKLWS